MPRKLLIINGLLIVIAAGSVVFIARHLMAPLPMPLAARSRPAPPAVAQETAPGNRAGAYTTVAARNLFSPTRTEGQSGAVASTAAPAVKPGLFGIVLRDGAPVAYLEDPSTKRVAGYRVGDALAGGTLQTIGADSVVIHRLDGNLEQSAQHLDVINPAARKDDIATIVRWAKILKKHGASFMVVAVRGTKREGYDFAAHRANIVSALNDYGKALADLGVGSGLHQHTNTPIETRDEVYAVMESVDTKVFKFAPDVGQLQKGGADAAKVVKDFASITVHMHLKDFVNGPHMGGYSPLGIGKVDLKSILETMEQANPKANIMHELDGSRDMPYTARQTAEISKWYLQKLGYLLGS